MKRMVQFLLAMTWALLLTPAHAQTTSYAGLDHIQRIIAGTPGVAGYTIGGIQDGVTLRTTGNVLVGAPNGVRIPVPVTASATVSKAALAKAAGKLFAGASIIGTAYTGYEVYKWIKDSGITTCAPPDFFCKPSVSSTPTFTYRVSGTTFYPTTVAACTAAGGSLNANGERCIVAGNFNLINYQGACSSPYVTSGSATGTLPISAPPTCSLPAGTNPPSAGAYTPDELVTAVTGTNWDPARSKAINDAILADNARQKLLTQEDLKPGTSELTWPGLAPVTGTPTVTKTETVPNADGSTSTRKTTETVTVTPVAPAASTLAAPASPEFKASTSTVVQTTNNTTNITTTESTSVTNYAPATEAPKVDIPTDYARETTVQQIERDLNTDSAKELPDQDKRVTDGVKASDDGLKALRDAVTAAQQTDKSMWFSWVWTPPVGTCQAQTRTLSNHAVVNWDVCPAVNNIRDVLGWMMALFSCWSIYCEIFRSPND